MKKTYILLISVLITHITLAQCNGRYESAIFNSVDTTTVYYSDNIIYQDDFHKMDIYIPNGDTVTNRPLIIFLHGGSFLGGDKAQTECVDFCTEFAKKGYVTASPNYRYADDAQSFALFQEEQYKTVLKSVSDIKGAIRYFRHSFANGNPYGIDENAIFIGGSSAGAVAALHLAYIDNMSDLPTIVAEPLTGGSFNVQQLVASIGGDLEGDAGYFNYSSKVNGVISFAGGINDVNWIDSNDEPLVSCQGDIDQTVSYNCGPGLGVPTVLELCGTSAMHPQADLVNIINEKLVFTGADHGWCSAGNNDPKFIQAMNFTTTFLYPLLPCNDINSISQAHNNKELHKVINIIGQDARINNNQILFFIYNDGSVNKKVVLE